MEGTPAIEEWISWVDPKLKEPDFHVPATLEWLEFGKQLRLGRASGRAILDLRRFP